MSCPCPSPQRSELWTPTPEFRQPTFITQGENIDCASRRAGSLTQKKEDHTDYPQNLIDNVSIPVGCDLSINVQFKLTPGSTITPTSWDMVAPDDSAESISGLTMSSSGLLSGTVDSFLEGRTFTVKIRAFDGITLIDSRTYTFVPKTCKEGDDLSFIDPLPGSVVTSRFGPRVHPVRQTQNVHTGVDLAYSGGVTQDVLAACDGEVTFAGPRGSAGIAVIMRHGNGSGKFICDTHYYHLRQVYVRSGQKVAAGTKIGHEGNTGVGTGPHLHFELRPGGNTPVDPIPYIRGSKTVFQETNPDNTGKAGTDVVVNNGNNVALSRQESTARSGTSEGAEGPCVEQVMADPSAPEPPQPVPPPQNIVPYTASCTNPVVPSIAQVKADIDAVLGATALTADDKLFIHTVAKIESRYNPFARNPTSSALGLYQFLTPLATHYYGILGIPPTCENRCNATFATQAMVLFYTTEILPYHVNWLASGKLTIAGKPIKPTAHSARYLGGGATVTKGEFLYGLIHHDGVGNAVNGRDLQGIQYWVRATQTSYG